MGWLESLNLQAVSPWLAVTIALLGGVVSSFSPCALASVPLLVGSVGGYREHRTNRASVYSLVFSAGLVVAFTVLGGFAAFGGQLL